VHLVAGHFSGRILDFLPSILRAFSAQRAPRLVDYSVKLKIANFKPDLVFSQWDRIFKDPMTTMAAVDRLVHHSTILDFSGESVRREKSRGGRRQATFKARLFLSVQRWGEAGRPRLSPHPSHLSHCCGESVVNDDLNPATVAVIVVGSPHGRIQIFVDQPCAWNSVVRPP